MILTKEDVYEKAIFTKRPPCPYCGERMKLWEVTESGCTCGSGWGTPYLFVCFNDNCPPFVNAWTSMKQDYGKRCSYRCFCYPDSLVQEVMLVYSFNDGKTGIVSEEKIEEDKQRGTDADPAVEALFYQYEQGDIHGLMDTLFDNRIYHGVRSRAAELIGSSGKTEVVESLRCHFFHDSRVDREVDHAIEMIHHRHHTRECPFCCEIIRDDISVCSECGKKLSWL